MTITAQMVKELREKTGCGIMDCKHALKEAQGDINKAVEAIKIKGLSKATKKATRAVSQGRVASYIHMKGRIGVLAEINCETDFVANTAEFQELCKEICMQVAAAHPKFVRTEDVPEAFSEQERRIFHQQVIESGKPAKIADKIVIGKMNKLLKEVCLMEQEYIRDTKMTVADLVKSYIAKLG